MPSSFVVYDLYKDTNESLHYSFFYPRDNLCHWGPRRRSLAFSRHICTFCSSPAVVAPISGQGFGRPILSSHLGDLILDRVRLLEERLYDPLQVQP